MQDTNHKIMKTMVAKNVSIVQQHKDEIRSLLAQISYSENEIRIRKDIPSEGWAIKEYQSGIYNCNVRIRELKQILINIAKRAL